ncbi:MAG: hypothetical protein MUE44_33045 [Oscillatoriaceae cyanobacterium Prado104]|jgi:hypothetical protein|nr:hypothetical protein [Oscillatoriaceae cyanobacterium Prado104]
MPSQEPSAFSDKQPDPKLPPAVDVDELLAAIEHSDDFYWKMMNLEVWALVETLDGIFPGAWGEFMTNRQAAVKQFLKKEEGRRKS